MKKLLSLTLCLCLLLTGCALPAELAAYLAREEEPENTINIYRLYTGDEGGSLARAEVCTLAANVRGDAETAIELFFSPSRDSSLQAALPEEVALRSWSVEGGVAVLDLSAEFQSLSAMDQTAAAFCAALTLCELDEVDAVSIHCEGQPLFQGLVPDDALLQDTDADPYTRRLRLYFSDAAGQYLVSEYHSLSLDEDSSLERYVLEELLRGPNDPELRSVIPAGTRLLSCRTENGVCTVDLSAEFLSGKPDTALGERLTIYSIVNSLGALANVESVQLLCQGQTMDRYLYRSLAQPLESWSGAVGPANAAKGEIDALLYRPLPGLTALTAMPTVIATAGYADELEALLAALTAQGEPGYPSLLQGTDGIRSVVTQGYSCTVDLNESFFASLSAEERAAAIGSLSASLCSLEEIRAVFITMNGGEAVYDGVSYTGPWNTENIIIQE